MRERDELPFRKLTLSTCNNIFVIAMETDELSIMINEVKILSDV